MKQTKGTKPSQLMLGDYTRESVGNLLHPLIGVAMYAYRRTYFSVLEHLQILHKDSEILQSSDNIYNKHSFKEHNYAIKTQFIILNSFSV